MNKLFGILVIACTVLAFVSVAEGFAVGHSFARYESLLWHSKETFAILPNIGSNVVTCSGVDDYSLQIALQNGNPVFYFCYPSYIRGELGEPSAEVSLPMVFDRQEVEHFSYSPIPSMDNSFSGTQQEWQNDVFSTTGTGSVEMTCSVAKGNLWRAATPAELTLFGSPSQLPIEWSDNIPYGIFTGASVNPTHVATQGKSHAFSRNQIPQDFSTSVPAAPVDNNDYLGALACINALAPLQFIAARYSDNLNLPPSSGIPTTNVRGFGDVAHQLVDQVIHQEIFLGAALFSADRPDNEAYDTECQNQLGDMYRLATLAEVRQKLTSGWTHEGGFDSDEGDVNNVCRYHGVIVRDSPDAVVPIVQPGVFSATTTPILVNQATAEFWCGEAVLGITNSIPTNRETFGYLACIARPPTDFFEF